MSDQLGPDAPDKSPHREVHVGTHADFDDERRRVATLDGTEIVVFRHGDGYYALGNTCLHMGGPVGEGILMPKVNGKVAAGGSYLGDEFSADTTHLVCPWHGWEYDIESGRHGGDPRLSLPRYSVVVRGEDVYVQV